MMGLASIAPPLLLLLVALSTGVVVATEVSTTAAGATRRFVTILENQPLHLPADDFVSPPQPNTPHPASKNSHSVDSADDRDLPSWTELDRREAALDKQVRSATAPPPPPPPADVADVVVEAPGKANVDTDEASHARKSGRRFSSRSGAEAAMLGASPRYKAMLAQRNPAPPTAAADGTTSQPTVNIDQPVAFFADLVAATSKTALRDGGDIFTTTGENCAASDVLRVDFAHGRGGDGRLYGAIWGSGFHAVETHDWFEYEVMWLTPQCNCGAEIESAGEWRLRDHGGLDASGFSPHSEFNANMSAVAFRSWHRRRWPLRNQTGTFIDKYLLSAFAPPGSRGTALFRRIVIVSVDPGTGSEKVRKAIWLPGASIAPSVQATYFNGHFRTSCQSTTLLAEVARVRWIGRPLRRGRATRLELTLRAIHNIGDGAASFAAAAAEGGHHGDVHHCGARTAHDVSTECPDERAWSPPSSLTQRAAAQMMEPPPSSRWGRGDAPFHAATHTREQRVAVLVLNWTARLRHAQYPDVTVWDLLMTATPPADAAAGAIAASDAAVSSTTTRHSAAGSALRGRAGWRCRPS